MALGDLIGSYCSKNFRGAKQFFRDAQAYEREEFNHSWPPLPTLVIRHDQCQIGSGSRACAYATTAAGAARRY